MTGTLRAMSGGMNIQDFREGYDWRSAVEVSRIARVAQLGPHQRITMTVEDVVEITHASVGENDGPNWLCVGRLNDGQWFSMVAGCDYTGWDCKASGEILIGDSFEEVARFGLGNEDRERLGIVLDT